MAKPRDDFEKQVLQIAALGVWQIVTGRPMKSPLQPIGDTRWEAKDGLFVTLKKNSEVRGSMGMLESSTSLQETLFNVAQTAATHDQRHAPVEENEIRQLDIEVTLLSAFQKMKSANDLKIGEAGIIVSRGEKQGVLLPQIAREQKWTSEQFLEACCEKAGLSHKAWKDPNTLVEYFTCRLLEGGNLFRYIEELV